jgi:Zn-dependent metalloprotease
LRLDNPDEELQVYRKQADGLGRRHYRYVQRYGGLPVWPTGLIVHLDPGGDVDLMDGTYVPTPSRIPDRPAIDAEPAAARARAAIPHGQEAQAISAELIIFAPTDRPARLAWKLELATAPDARWLAVVDAATGRVLSLYNRIETAGAVLGAGLDLFGAPEALNLWKEGGRYWMVDTSKPMFDPASDPPRRPRGAITILDARNRPATSDPIGQPFPRIFAVVSDLPDGGWLADAVSASANLSTAYDYYYNVHGRNSADGQGGGIRSIVRLARNYPNAFWNSDSQTIFFGDALPFAGALDVVAHEFTHGVTDADAGLVYSGESGALSEAFSDIFGEMAEAYAKGGAADWLHGVRLGQTARDLRDPGSLVARTGQPYPAAMDQFVRTTQDNGGVHYNSTIVSHAYYLLAEGQGGAIGLGAAERIFYRALALHLTPGAQFLDARLACVQSAEELFGAGSTEALKTQEAFEAVGIREPQADPAAPGPPAIPDSVLFAYLDPLLGLIFPGRREAALGDGEAGTALDFGPISERTRPSVTADGVLALLVDIRGDICLLETQGSAPPACLGLDFVRTAALSPDGRRIAYALLGEPTGRQRIHYYDIGSRKRRSFGLAAPTGTRAAPVGGMEITPDNRYLLYAAQSPPEPESGAEAAGLSLYALDLGTGNRLALVPPTPGRDLYAPALSRALDTLFAFTARDTATGTASIYIGDLGTGALAEVVKLDRAPAGAAFSGDDSALVYGLPDPATATGYSLWRLPLNASRLAADGEPGLWLRNAMLGTVYRRGAYSELRIKKTGRGSGAVVSTPEGIDCGRDCSALYPTGAQVALTAKADYGSVFRHWRGACGGNGACGLIIGGKAKVRARFGKLPTARIKIELKTKGGGGRVVSAPDGIDCGEKCRARFPKGTPVELTAVPGEGSSFVGWGGACRGAGACAPRLDRSRRVVARFAAPGP